MSQKITNDIKETHELLKMFRSQLTSLFTILNKSFSCRVSVLDFSTSAKLSMFSGDMFSWLFPPYSWTSNDKHCEALTNISVSSLGS